VIQPAGPSLTVCEGTTVTLSSQNTAPNYTWFLGNQSNPPAVGFGPTLSASLPGVYRLQLNNNGCRSDLSGVLLLNTTPAPIIANIGADTVICQGNPFVFFPPTVIGNTTSQCWETITTAPGLINCSGLISPNAVPPGVYNLRYVASNGSCSDTAFRTVTIIPNIDSEILGAQTLEICEGDTAILVAGATGTGVGYEWLVGNVSIPGSNNDTLFVTQAGEYRVRILINGNGTCASASTDFAVVSVKPSPNVSYSGDPLLKVCFPGPPADLNTIRPYAPFDATWSYSGPEAIVTPNGLLRPENFVADGLYTLILQKTIGTCSDTVSLKIQANRIPDATFSSTSQTICEGQNIELNYVNPLNYNTTWFRENAVVAINQDSLLLSQAGTYKLLVDNNGCSDEKSASFEVQPLPTFELPGNTESCKNGTSLQFFPINPSPGLGAWSGPGVSGTGGWDPSDPDVPASGPITISYTRTSEFGCAVTKSFEILINPVPAIQLNSNLDTIEIFGPAILTATGGSGYVWSPANSLSAATGPEVNARPSESTEYTVTVTTEKGCIGSAKKLIVVDQEFKIYDGFSPNDDQRNDRWVIKNIQRYPAARVKVFNRWGNEVYASEPGYPKPWDGKYEGNPVPPGAYYYVVDLGEGLTPKSGSITIVR
jgi:gliding motility-associated-like protein